MENGKTNSLREAFNELVKAIQYRNDSKKGLLSMDSFLDIIGDACDKEIENTKGEGANYIHGECVVEKNEESSLYKFYINLVFSNISNETFSKNMTLEKNFDDFTRETINLFDNKSEVIYSIYDKE